MMGITVAPKKPAYEGTRSDSDDGKDGNIYDVNPAGTEDASLVVVYFLFLLMVDYIFWRRMRILHGIPDVQLLCFVCILLLS
mmetsp:Transcript_21625/g.32051  ORF Transcript_21625/g.32051 Transcript_21625/m.32051 type:complete len:82 (-) Transcript_21625:98-343(-)